MEAICILSQTIISKSNLEYANNLLNQFVANTEVLYSKSAMTYNVHQLTHIAQSVKDWGPLWAHSGYPFEGGNGKLLTFIQAAKGVPYQITRCISIRQKEILIKSCVLEKSTKIVEFYNYLHAKNVQKTLQSDSVRYFGAPVRVHNSKFQEELELSNEVSLYKRLTKDSCLYSSKCNKRSNNSYALLKNNTYIQISYFLHDENKKQDYTIYKTVKTSDLFVGKSNFVKKVIKVDNKEMAVKSDNLDKICVFMNAGDNQYICSVPNVYIS